MVTVFREFDIPVEWLLVEPTRVGEDELDRMLTWLLVWVPLLTSSGCAAVSRFFVDVRVVSCLLCGIASALGFLDCGKADVSSSMAD